MQIAGKQAESCFPFTACGFFNLDRETLTSMAATTLTYLVVLIQFQVS